MVLALASAGTLLLLPETSQADSGIGGGTAFTNGSIFPFISGIETSLSSSFFVQNIGDEVMELELSHGAPRGITIEPVEGQQLELGPMESTVFTFEITVDETVAADTYPLILNLRQANLDDTDAQGSVYRPALSGSFVIDVRGASATVNFSSISSLNGLPAVGDLSLYYLGQNGIDTLIYEDNSSEYSVAVVPGNYRATFDIPNLQRQSIEFSIAEDEVKDIVLEIPTLEFISVGATPTRDDRDVIQLVSLSMDVFNNLRELPGPIEFVSNVYHNGELVDEFVIETLPNLPEGPTLQRATYDRPDGFDQGEWTFQFLLRNNEFEVGAEQQLRVQSPGLLQSYIQELLLVLAALVIIGLLMPKSWWLILLRRKKKDEEEQQPKTARRIPAKTTLPAKKPKREIELPEINVEPIFAKAKDWFAAISKPKERDPEKLIYSLMTEINQLEDQGLRTLQFNYDLDAVFAKEGEAVINKSTQKPYSSEEVNSVAIYKDKKEKLKSINRPDLEQKVRVELIKKRVDARSAGGDK